MTLAYCSEVCAPRSMWSFSEDQGDARKENNAEQQISCLKQIQTLFRNSASLLSMFLIENKEKLALHLLT